MAASSAPANPAACRTVLKTAGPSLLLNVVCPWAAFQILTAQGVGAVPAVAATTVFPIFGTVVGWVRSGRPDVFGLLTLLLIVLSLAVAFAVENPLVILLRGAISDAALALLCVGTLAFGKPLMFYAARQLVAGWDRAASAAFDARWEQPAFRQAMRRITIAWGCWFGVQTIGRVVAVELLPVSIYLAVWPLISTLGTLAMISWSMNYGRRGAGRRWNPATDGARLGEDSRRALDRAGEEAKRHRHRYVGTEHLLVALCDDETVAARALRNVGVTAGGARATFEIWVAPGNTPSWREPEYAPQMHSVLWRVDDARRATGAGQIGTEHLLFSLAADDEGGQAAFLLRQMGVDLGALRERLLGFRELPPPTEG